MAPFASHLQVHAGVEVYVAHASPHRYVGSPLLRVVADEVEAQSKTATEKLKEKKKMSFEEFKALLDKGLV